MNKTKTKKKRKFHPKCRCGYGPFAHELLPGSLQLRRVSPGGAALPQQIARSPPLGATANGSAEFQLLGKSVVMTTLWLCQNSY